MTVRNTQEIVDVEYRPTTNILRGTQEIVDVEYRPTTNILRTDQFLIMVEYVTLPAGTPRFGPAFQMMW
jgi:hypothetical protein